MNNKKDQLNARGPVSLSEEDDVQKILIDSVYGLWNIVNNLTRLKPSRREFYRVSIFGSARAKEGSPIYEKVKLLSEELSALGCDIITGGGPGLMQAANEGAILGDPQRHQRSIGIRIGLPFEQEVNKYVEEVHTHQTFFTRLHHFVLASDAFIVVPGGIGTALETFIVWQLLQVKHLPPTPLILMGKMYQELLAWAERSMLLPELPLANPEDIKLPVCVDSIEQAVELIKVHHAAWKAHPDYRPTKP